MNKTDVSEVNDNTILLVINCLQGGGAERSVLTLGKGFYDLGYDVHILRFKSTVEYELDPALNYHQLNFKPFKLIPSTRLRHRVFAKAFDKYVLRHIGRPKLTVANLDRADRVLAFSELPNIVHVIRNTISEEINQKRSQGKKVSINDIRNIYAHQPCVGISEGVTDDFRDTLKLDNITTIYNPIDKVAIENLSKALDIELAPYIVHVGSFKYQKAHDVLIRAYANSNRTYPLYLIGQGKLLNEMKELVSTLGISDDVKFLGFQKNPYPYIKHAKLMVLSSRFEGFGRVIAEALALDTPVISTDCPSGPREMLPEKNLTPVDDVTALTELLNDAMENPAKYAVAFDKKFSPTYIAEQFINLIG